MDVSLVFLLLSMQMAQHAFDIARAPTRFCLLCRIAKVPFVSIFLRCVDQLLAFHGTYRRCQGPDGKIYAAPLQPQANVPSGITAVLVIDPSDSDDPALAAAVISSLAAASTMGGTLVAAVIMTGVLPMMLMKQQFLLLLPATISRRLLSTPCRGMSCLSRNVIS